MDVAVVQVVDEPIGVLAHWKIVDAMAAKL